MNNNNNNIRLDDKFMQVNIVLHKTVHFKNSFLFDFFFLYLFDSSRSPCGECLGLLRGF